MADVDSASLRRGAKVFIKSTESFVLQPSTTEPKKGCLKVMSLDDSLSALERRVEKPPKKHRSLRKKVSSIMKRGASFGFGRKASRIKEQQQQQQQEENNNRSGMTALDESSTVRFDTIFVREYEKIVDINPGVSKGPAMGIGWEYQEFEPISVDIYEEHHPPRRKMKEIKLSMMERIDRLKESGYSRKEIQEAVKRTNIARKRRKATLEGLEHSRLHEKMEVFKRCMQRTFRLRKNIDEEFDELWDAAQQ